MLAWAVQEDAALKEALYNQRQQPAPEASSVPPLPDAVKLGFLKDPRSFSTAIHT